MSDGLDDFFAKKDKKKKGKSKVTNNDLVNTEEVKETKKIKKKSKESEAKPAANSGTGNEPASEQTPAPEQTEEWSEYVEEKETDYSGLRIQSIQIRDEDQDQGDKDKDKGQDGDDEDGEEGSEPTASGVWSAVSQPQSQQSELVEPPPKKEEPVIAAPSARSGGYVIPSKRSGASGATLDPMPSRQMRRKREAPNLKSEEDFPTLGGGPPDDAGGAWGSGRFEKVKSGARVEEQSSRGQRLELGNKYDALRGGGD